MYILRPGLFYPATATTVVCCISMQTLCVVSQKSLSFWGTPFRGSAPGPQMGDFRPQDPQSSFMSPNNHVRSTPFRCIQAVSPQVTLSHPP